jgi:NitT/TauT family transport system substrate-binding protein
VNFIDKYPLPQMPAELEAGVINAAVLPEPFATIAEETDGAVPVADLNQGATTSFPVEGYVVTKQWALKHPHTLTAFYRHWNRASGSRTPTARRSSKPWRNCR